jgi:hypothetical protein
VAPDAFRAALISAHEQKQQLQRRQNLFNFLIWALLLTAKQDTVKTCNQISDTLWEALSGESF